MKTIFWFEWKAFYRNPVYLVLAVAFLLVGMYSVRYGKRVIQAQSVRIDSLNTAYETTLRLSAAKFEADTTTRQGRMDYASVADPASVNYLVKPYAVFYPNAFSALSIGQRDVLPFYKEISSEKSISQPYAQDIANPEVLAEGNINLSFVIIYLIPLLLIALSYNVFSGERENGTLYLLSAQSLYPDRLLLYKFLFRVLVVLLMMAVIHGYAFYQVKAIAPLQVNDMVAWSFAVLSYTAFWAGVCGLFISFRKSSVLTAFYLFGSWLLLTIVLPFLLSLCIEYRYPPVLRTDVASAQRKLEEDVWDINPKDLIYSFYRHHPQYKTGNVADTFQYSPRRFAAYYDELERRLLPVVSGYNNRIAERNGLMRSLAEGLPTTRVQKILNGLGRSDAESFRQFDESSGQFQQQWQASLYHFIFNDRQFQQRDYRQFPSYTTTANNDAFRKANNGSLLLLLLSAGLFIMATFINHKNKNNSY